MLDDVDVQFKKIHSLVGSQTFSTEKLQAHTKIMTQDKSAINSNNGEHKIFTMQSCCVQSIDVNTV